MGARWTGGTSRRGERLRWLLALAPLVPLVGTLLFGGGGHAITLALQVLFTIAAGCHLVLAFDLVAKLRDLGAGEAPPKLRAAAIRVALSFALFWIAFALALGLHKVPLGAGFPTIYAIYCVAMLALLLLAFAGAWLLGRMARTRATNARPQRRIS
jgi:hypothetical protein